ncbi:MAG: energy transducer TonB [Acidobacteriaceae bacterium]
MMRSFLLSLLILAPVSSVVCAQNSAPAPAQASASLACPAEMSPPSQTPHKWIAVSAGIATRNRIGGKDPKYPKDAKKAHVEGRVVLMATISAAGQVEDACVVQGPEPLRQAAFDAVKTWTYRPFELNGHPLEVKTQMNVDFTLH